MYKLIIRHLLAHPPETWTLCKTKERRLDLFERKVLQCNFGAKQEDGTWRERYSSELCEIFNESNTVNHIKAKRLAWAGHWAE
jgi:hypothetical protein